MMMYIKNRPALSRRAIWFRIFYSSTSKASPNDTAIVIIIVIVGKLDAGVHRSRIIAQSRFSVEVES
ncbi:MAG TPA: hypothetical protein DCY14_14830 [Anaerolineae bacterium]|nr:hypothetical protein [Anaerolineae bacterium]